MTHFAAGFCFVLIHSPTAYCITFQDFPKGMLEFSVAFDGSPQIMLAKFKLKANDFSTFQLKNEEKQLSIRYNFILKMYIS